MERPRLPVMRIAGLSAAPMAPPVVPGETAARLAAGVPSPATGVPMAHEHMAVDGAVDAGPLSRSNTPLRPTTGVARFARSVVRG